MGNEQSRGKKDEEDPSQPQQSLGTDAGQKRKAAPPTPEPSKRPNQASTTTTVNISHSTFHKTNIANTSIDQSNPESRSLPQNPGRIDALLENIKKPECKVGVQAFRHRDIPVVHPQMNVIEFYMVKKEISNKRMKKKKNYQSKELFEIISKIKFEELKETLTNNRLTGIVGSPGYGKTTISERLVGAWGKACFHLKCLEMNYGSREITLKQLLVDLQNPDFTKEECQQLFDWIVKNQELCLFDFDGMDQPSWKLNKVKPLPASYDTPMRVEQLMFNLLSKKFLPKAHISVTSRPHTFVDWPEKIRPAKFILVSELSQRDMKKLFFAFAGKRALELWSTLESNSPHLLNLCLIPIMLQLVILALLNSDDYSKIETVTQVFQDLLQNFHQSPHSTNELFTTEHKKTEIRLITKQISQMAYNATKKETVIITPEELQNAKLSDADVQDVIITIPNLKGFECRILEGNKNRVFTHQLFQEYYTAYHMSQYMSTEMFSEIVYKVVTDPHWAMVRRFLCGLLLSGDFQIPLSSDQQTQGPAAELQKSTVCQPASNCPSLSTLQKGSSNPNAAPNSYNINGKAGIFYSELLKAYKKSPSDVDLLADLRETNNAVRKSFAKHFPAQFDFKGQNFSTSDIHAVACILRHVEQMKVLDLSKKSLTASSVRLIADAVKEGKVKVNRLKIGNIEKNKAKSLLSIIEHVEELELGGCKLTSESLEIICNEISEQKCKKKMLHLSKNTISNDEAESLSSIVEYVEELHLRWCELSSESIAIICNAISEKKCKMKKLNLQVNTISNDGAESVSSIVEYVEELHLGWCKLSSESIAIICNAISEKKCKMKELDLYGNTISNDVAESLSSIVEYVERLDVRGCGLTKEGREVIRSKLRELDLPMERVLVT